MSKDRGKEALLRKLVGSDSWLFTGTIAKIEAHASFGFLADVTLQPSEKFVQCRLVFLGTGQNRGSYDPVDVGDEVLVLLPAFDGHPDANAGIAIAGLNSALLPMPSSFNNTQPERIHPDGYNFRTANGEAVAALVRKDMLDDFATWLGLFDTFLSVASSATTAVQIATAAGVMITGLTGAFGSPGGFTSRVGGAATGYRSKGVQSD